MTSGQRPQSWSPPEEGFGMPEGLQHRHRKVPALWGTPHGDLARPCRCGQRCSFRVICTALETSSPHIILLPVSQAFATCKGLKRFLCAGLIFLGSRVDLGGLLVGFQPCDLATQVYTAPCRSAWELANCTGSSQSTNCSFPSTHLHLMSSNFPL